jgi:hypothetical protein
MTTYLSLSGGLDKLDHPGDRACRDHFLPNDLMVVSL